MAWIEHRGGCIRVVFRYGGEKFQHPLKTDDTKEADGQRARIEENLKLLERGRLELPADADLPTFLLSDGKLSKLPQVSKSLTLGELSERYQEAITLSLEANSRYTIAIHLRHVLKTFGAGFRVPELKAADLQEHINRRVKAKGRRKKPLSAYTIRKELVTFGAAFKWGVEMGLLKGAFSNKGLRYPKMVERPPFMTWQEISKRIEAGGLSAEEASPLWESLFLSRAEIKDLLDYARENARHGWIYPMMALAAHTGARRSELLRAEVSDVDFLSKTFLIREKKKTKGRETTRRVPLSPFVIQVLTDWMKKHPGGVPLFVQEAEIVRSRNKRTMPVPVTLDEAQDHFSRTLTGSRWCVARGWHTLRHSFASNCAASGVDQRLINTWMGHQTQEMERRYRHLFPDQQQTAIVQVFGDS